MSESTTRRKKRAGTSDAPHRVRDRAIGVPRHELLGIDREGHAHHLDRDIGAVWRIAPTSEWTYRVPLLEVDDVETMPQGVRQYLAHVDAAVGWAQQRHICLFGDRR